MSRRGNPYENAMAEDFFSILKTECFRLVAQYHGNVDGGPSRKPFKYLVNSFERDEDVGHRFGLELFVSRTEQPTLAIGLVRIISCLTA